MPSKWTVSLWVAFNAVWIAIITKLFHEHTWVLIYGGVVIIGICIALMIYFKAKEPTRVPILMLGVMAIVSVCINLIGR